MIFPTTQQSYFTISLPLHPAQPKEMSPFLCNVVPHVVPLLSRALVLLVRNLNAGKSKDNQMWTILSILPLFSWT